MFQTNSVQAKWPKEERDEVPEWCLDCDECLCWYNEECPRMPPEIRAMLYLANHPSKERGQS